MNLKIIFNGLFNLAIRRYLGVFWYRRLWLAKTEKKTRVELEKIQLKLLLRIIRHSYNTVPWYKNLMDKHSITLDDFHEIGDIKKLPILTKTDVLSAGQLLISKKYPKWLTRTVYTGGTTGSPLKLVRTLFSIGNEHAFVRRQWDWASLGLNDKCAYLKGRVISDINSNEGNLFAYDPFMKELILSTYHLSEDTALEYVIQIKKYKILALAGFPSAVYLLAKFCIQNNFNLKLKSILTTSETLTKPMRQTIKDAFGAKIFDFYGSAERVCYIFTCEEGSYHLNPEYGLTELIPCDDFKNNSKYKIIATGFWGFGMPLIRYDTGDLVTKSDIKCNCGREFSVLSSIEGREIDVIKTVSGRVLTSATSTHLLYGLHGVDNIIESQIIQKNLGSIVIKYVPNNEFEDKNLKELKELVSLNFPAELQVEYSQVKNIERTKSGKLRPIIPMKMTNEKI